MQQILLIQARQRRRQWAGLVLACLTLGALGGYWIYHERALTLAREQERLLHQVRVIDANLNQQLLAVNSALQSLRVGSQALNADERSTITLRMRTLSDAMPGVRTMFVTDGDGKIVVSNRPEVVGIDGGKRPYFTAARLHPDADSLYVSEPFLTRVNNIYAMNLVKTWAHADGEFGGIVSATLDPAYFEVLLHSVLYADDVRSTLVHGNGQVFVGLPVTSAQRPGTLLGPETLFSAHRKSGADEDFYVTPNDAAEGQRLVAYRTVRAQSLHLDFPMVLEVSRKMDAVLIPWRKMAYFFVLNYLLFTALAIAGLCLLQRKQSELTLISVARTKESQDHAQRLDMALEAGNLGLIDLDMAAGLRKVNARTQQLLGDGPDDPVDTVPQWIERMHPDDRSVALVVREVDLQGNRDIFEVDYRVKHKEGHWVWLHFRGKVIERSALGEPLRMIGTYQDISARKAEEALLVDFAFLDPLTKLPNRRLLMDRLIHTQVVSARSHKHAAMLYMDLDRFKWVNDTLGHGVGDILLQHVATRVQAAVRQSDTVARLGGDEFVVLLDQLSETLEEAQLHAQRMAEKILLALAEPVQLGTREHTMTSSIGITLFCGDACTAEQLLKQADSALYQAKAEGRNRAVLYTPAAAD